MKIRILTNCYPPEIGAAANQLYELAQALTAKGHIVSVVTRFPRHLPIENVPKNNGRWLIEECRPEAMVTRVNIPLLSRKVPLMRELEHLLNILFLAIASLSGDPPEVTLVYSPPIVVGYAALFARLFNNSKIVLNVQDLFPQSLIDLGLLKNRFLIMVSRWLEKLLYRRVNHLTVMSKTNQQIVAETAGNSDKVTVVYNWVDTDYIRPGERDNEIRKEFGLEGKFVLTFAGCIADSQDMDIILNTAKKLVGEKDLLFLIAGNGPKFTYTERKIREQALDNVMIVPILPRDRYVKLLAASDVALVTLSPRVTTPVVPSKMLSIMSAARPIIASLPLSGDAPGFIRESGCGLVVPAGDNEGFLAAVKKLQADPGLRKKMGAEGRKTVVEKYSLQAAARVYEAIFKKVIAHG